MPVSRFPVDSLWALTAIPRLFFRRQIDFIQQSGIVAAMVGLLNAPKNTKLYKRLESENRLTTEATGNNTDSSMNFIPKMNTKDLLEGYKKIIQNIYGTKPYYKRIRQFLLNYKRVHGKQMKIEFFHVGAFYQINDYNRNFE